MKKTIIFDSDLYSNSAVNQACESYKGIAKINTEVKNDKIICKCETERYDIDIVCYEFSNYVLGLTVQAGNAYEMD